MTNREPTIKQLKQLEIELNSSKETYLFEATIRSEWNRLPETAIVNAMNDNEAINQIAHDFMVPVHQVTITKIC